MAGTKYGSFAVGDANIDNVMLNLAGINTGYCAITLTEMTTTNVPQIAAGSKIEVGGSLFKFDANETITGTATTGANYIRLVPSGSSITAEWTTTAPTWSDSKQGWYDSTGAKRYVPVKVRLTTGNYVKVGFSNPRVYDGGGRITPVYTEEIKAEVINLSASAIVTGTFGSTGLDLGKTFPTGYTVSNSVVLMCMADSGSNDWITYTAGNFAFSVSYYAATSSYALGYGSGLYGKRYIIVFAKIA